MSSVKKTVYEVNVPPPNPFHVKEWRSVTEYESLEEALKFVKENYNADSQGRVSLIHKTEK